MKSLLVWLALGGGMNARAASPAEAVKTPAELFGKAYDNLNGRRHQGRYTITGEGAQMGTFVAEFKLPEQLTWTLRPGASKVERTFEWSKKAGIRHKGAVSDSGPVLKLFDTIPGRLALETMFASLPEWRTGGGMSSMLVQMSAKFAASGHLLQIDPLVPGLNEYRWEWSIAEKPIRYQVTRWRIKNKVSQYLFEFGGDKE